MPQILLQDTNFEYEIARKARSVLSMTLSRENVILVKAPVLMPDFLIRKFVEGHTTWIIKQAKKNDKLRQERPEIEYKNGEKIMFMGVGYPLSISESPLAKTPRIYFIKNSFQVAVLPGLTPTERQKVLKKAFQTWYKRNCKKPIEERARALAKQMGVTFNGLRIKDVKGHWGSCSSAHNLNFNFHLATLPHEMIDYVIIHELCHLTELNHSIRFWKLVEKYVPNYKKIIKEIQKISLE